MPVDILAPFQKLSAALNQLETVAARLPKGDQMLIEHLRQRGQEEEQTQHALTAEFHELVSRYEAASTSIKQADQVLRDRFDEYRGMLTKSVRSLQHALEEPRNEMDALGEILYNALYEQRARLGEYNQGEVEVDLARRSTLQLYVVQLASGNQQLGDLLAVFGDASSASEAVTAIEQSFIDAETAQQGQMLSRAAVVAQRQGLPQTSLTLLEQATRAAPGDFSPWLHLAQLQLNLDRRQEAEITWQRAAEISPHSPEVTYVEGLIARAGGDVVRALACFEQCVDATSIPANAVAYRLSLAEAHYRAGHPRTAVAEWHRVLELEPAHPIASAWLAAID